MGGGCSCIPGWSDLEEEESPQQPTSRRNINTVKQPISLRRSSSNMVGEDEKKKKYRLRGRSSETAKAHRG
eukprot:TRINITY_DN902_c0_g1_i1.p3 TRINITY_DN902_c0_g1~~TRINITY_DN902_c0_g1_i1.p3  ORF type:complete len:71 (+),score=30.27 TRINITY_DN902_c0_g1_i1:119-331(+)